MKSYFCLVLLTISLAANATDEQSAAVEELIKHWRPSLAAIMSDPESFVGESVSLFGYLHQVGDRGASFLFLSKDHAHHQDLSSAILVGRIDSEMYKSCGGGYVYLQGELQRVGGVSLSGGLLYVIPEPVRVSVSRSGGYKWVCWPRTR